VLRSNQSPIGNGRTLYFAGFCVLLALLFGKSLVALAQLASQSEQHSHILLVPLISAYLLYDRRRRLPSESQSSPVPGTGLMLGGLVALVLALLGDSNSVQQGESLAWTILSFVCLLAAGAFFLLGSRWVSAACFPIVFLLFMVPLPDRITELLEIGSQFASAEAAALLFAISGTSVWREDLLFQLPGLTIRVAQECSGIRSSLVLLITSFLAGQLFLKSPWRRAILVGLVIPLGILRNGFRIVTISLLTIHVDPRIIDSPLHHRGGPIFFVLSLIPFSLLLWWLRRSEQKNQPPSAPLPEANGATAV
jgi:exosortase C (VPDSG-CTERM-specific)